MESIKDRLISIRQDIKTAASQYGRNHQAIQLIAVSKGQSIKKIARAYSEGQVDFAENYAQEASGKIEKLKKHKINWHFIGALQSNKTKFIAEHFSWVHSVETLKQAALLSMYRQGYSSILQICMQVNISEEETKSGINIQDLDRIATDIYQLPNVCLRGLMAVPAMTNKLETQRESYRRLAQAKEKLNKHYPYMKLDTLSMGMSNDYIAAIAEGATLLRIGTAIFGERK